MLTFLLVVFCVFAYIIMGFLTGVSIGVYDGYLEVKEDERFPTPVVVILWPLLGTLFLVFLLCHACEYVTNLILDKVKEKK